MAGVKISELPAATAPLTGAELVPVVQGGVTDQVTVTNLTAGRAVSAQSVNISGLTANAPVFTDANKALTNVGTIPVANGGTGITVFGTGVAAALGQNVTGSGGIALATSPSFTTPALGVATATTVNKITFTPPATNATLTILDGKILTANNSIVLSGTDSTTMTFPSTNATIARTDAAQTFTGTQTFNGSVVPGTNVVDSVGYTGVPQNSQSTAYTLVASDAGKSIVHPATDNNARTFTIPANGTVAFPVGTTITFINMINTVTISITTDTLYLAGTGTTGSRTLAAYGMATAVKMTSTTWIISGNGLT